MICVYIIQNILNKKIYIGSTVDLYERLKTHFYELNKNIHHSNILQNSYNKYGFNNFEVKILKFCLKAELRKLEQVYLDTLNPEYNISTNASAPMEGRKHKPETIEKFKNRITKRGADSHLYGTKWSNNLREKILSKRIGSKRSLETKDKMSIIAKRINSINRIDRTQSYKELISSDGNVFKSITDCANFYNVSPSTIFDVLKGRSKLLKNKYDIQYKTESNIFNLKEKSLLKHQENINLKMQVFYMYHILNMEIKHINKFFNKYRNFARQILENIKLKEYYEIHKDSIIKSNELGKLTQ